MATDNLDLRFRYGEIFGEKCDNGQVRLAIMRRGLDGNLVLACADLRNALSFCMRFDGDRNRYRHNVFATVILATLKPLPLPAAKTAVEF